MFLQIMFLEYREQEKAKITGDCSCLKLGDMTTINLTGLSGGLAPNIVPNEFRATFESRPKSQSRTLKNSSLAGSQKPRAA